ncbi:hypothetical protein Misp01_02650 [Microtetraspora sp. NBRC 13810]|uniref:hypothetical protein n=1 Tax=Microtetraspora sp. NBRC 13810 TaxID=3030990 RepID=UPI0024A3BCED|nr:hypothetical protein [Microtetraspora sp. NBRC 13810]GLW05135.1 hypothetical protein Misp01_02650 [Microtetraspora sp. NBRC 13810]
MAGEQLEGTRRALRDALAQAERAAELARLLEKAQAGLADAEQATEELKAARERLGATEELLEQARAAEEKLRRELAEQRYQTEVARWKLTSMQLARWSRIGDALKTGKSNPVRLARGLRGAARPVNRPNAPKRQPVATPAGDDRQAAPGASFQARSSVRVIEGASFKLKPFRVPTGPNTRPHLTVAAVLDSHAEALLRYEWRQTVGFTPRDFARVLPLEIPHLLVVESVTGGPWAGEVTGEGGEGLRALLAWCAERGIRTVFWHTQGQVTDHRAVAGLFEYVFTASPEALPVWRSLHPRAGLLPYAVQPRVHNPLPLASGRFDRVLTLEELLPPPVHYPDVLTSYRWPRSVSCPPGTPEWRLAEIAACGTPIGSLPDDRRAHAALRRAYAAGTMSERVDDLLEAIGLPSARPTLDVSVIVPLPADADADRALAQVASQSGARQVVLMAADAEAVQARARTLFPGGTDVLVRQADPGLTTGGLLNRALDLCEGDLVAVMDPRDVYGEHYLTDMTRSFLFTTADVTGKASYFAHLRDAGATLLRQPDAAYSYLAEITGGTLLARRTVLRGLGIADVSDGWDDVLMRQCRADGVRVFSADRFGYVKTRDEDPALLASSQLVGYGPAEPHALA